MVAKYEKLNLAAFKKKLAEGGYANLAGARRAIGRMSTWSEADKNKARAIVEKHFEGGGASKPKKKAVKKKAKRGKKKATKKAAKKKTKKAKTKKTMKRVRRQQTGTESSPGSVMSRIQETTQMIDGFGMALNNMDRAKTLGASASSIQEGAKAAQEGLIQAVNRLCVLTRESSETNSKNADTWSKAVAAGTKGLGQQPAAQADVTVPPAPEAAQEN